MHEQCRLYEQFPGLVRQDLVFGANERSLLWEVPEEIQFKLDNAYFITGWLKFQSREIRHC